MRARGAIAEERLQPGGRIVFSTDGITEARDREGDFFGLQRLVDHLHRAATAGLPAPETLRRISHDVLDRQGGVLQDDATLLIAEWATTRERALVSADDIAAHELSPSRGEREDTPHC